MRERKVFECCECEYVFHTDGPAFIEDALNTRTVVFTVPGGWESVDLKNLSGHLQSPDPLPKLHVFTVVFFV